MKKKYNILSFIVFFSLHSLGIEYAAIYSIGNRVHSFAIECRKKKMIFFFLNFTNTNTHTHEHYKHIYARTHAHTYTVEKQKKKIIDIYCLETHDTRVQYRTLIIRYKMTCLLVVEIIIN